MARYESVGVSYKVQFCNRFGDVLASIKVPYHKTEAGLWGAACNLMMAEAKKSAHRPGSEVLSVHVCRIEGSTESYLAGVNVAMLREHVYPTAELTAEQLWEMYGSIN